VAGNVGYCSTLPSSGIRHLTSPDVYNVNRSYTKPIDASRITQCICHIKSSPHERSMLNCDKCNNNCTVKEVLLACKNFDFFKTQNSGCTLEATHFKNTATGHNRYCVIQELRSSVFCKIVAPVASRRGYPELPDLSENPRPYSIPLLHCRRKRSSVSHRHLCLL
jgi:hypothetical protein